MRSKVIFILSFLLIMALLPILISRISATKAQTASKNIEASQGESDEDNQNLTENNNSDKSREEIICGLLAGIFREEYCGEALKAFAVILNTDYQANPEAFDLNDGEICIFEAQATGGVKEGYNRIKSAVSEVKNKTLSKVSKAFYIPYFYSSDGTTEKSPDYPYLIPVASSWDCFCKGYSESDDCVGVSMYGINFLCQTGSDYAQALSWYLPDFEISEQAHSQI